MTNISGIIYVLTNPAMPGLVKIGKTARGSVNPRLGELYTTGVPVPFECAFAGRIANEGKVERAFHLAFDPYRLNPKREFFVIEPEQAIALLELMVSENVTPLLQREADAVDVAAKSASNKLKSRRPNLNFQEMGIAVGEELTLAESEFKCRVINAHKVEYENGEYSLTALKRKLLELDDNITSSSHWYYNGKSLHVIYNETYGPVTSEL